MQKLLKLGIACSTRFLRFLNLFHFVEGLLEVLFFGVDFLFFIVNTAFDSFD
jgi:hypothetical protein